MRSLDALLQLGGKVDNVGRTLPFDRRRRCFSTVLDLFIRISWAPLASSDKSRLLQSLLAKTCSIDLNGKVAGFDYRIFNVDRSEGAEENT
jgi:hypothetical protein